MRSRRKRTRIRCLRRFVKPGRLNMLTEICSIAATHASSSSCGAKMEQETTKEKKSGRNIAYPVLLAAVRRRILIFFFRPLVPRGRLRIVHRILRCRGVITLPSVGSHADNETPLEVNVAFISAFEVGKEVVPAARPPSTCMSELNITRVNTFNAQVQLLQKAIVKGDDVNKTAYSYNVPILVNTNKGITTGTAL